MKLSLEGCVAVVTGSSSGIGRAIALEFAKHGADLAISYHSDEAEGEGVAEEVRALGRKAFCGQLSVEKEESVEAHLGGASAALGQVNILVNNAGIDGKRVKISDSEVEDWDRVIAVNLRGPYLCSRAVLPGMIAQGKGVILNISSVHEVIPWSGHTAYCAAKAAMGMMTQSLALELQDSGVRVISLAPGAIKTPINEDVWSDPKGMADLRKKIPMQRIGETDEVAKIARVLVSDDASYMTGTTVTVDGGMTTYPSFAHGG